MLDESCLTSIKIHAIFRFVKIKYAWSWYESDGFNRISEQIWYDVHQLAPTPWSLSSELGGLKSSQLKILNLTKINKKKLITYILFV